MRLFRAVSGSFCEAVEPSAVDNIYHELIALRVEFRRFVYALLGYLVTSVHPTPSFDQSPKRHAR